MRKHEVLAAAVAVAAMVLATPTPRPPGFATGVAAIFAPA